ncbi:hypothetical protein BMF94_1872 [Rhodotorula taiwanensis]|uniref:Inorganic phosphate transporter n=1 Tax=Rhodotorula taiwanensis TaxID=741276 RepID=A0A2S5BDN9_9BASI|nr:hypothetical protein BMF94_1872 [Rhodotorula taiwanensis]
MVAPAIQNMILSLGAMQVARKIDFEDPQVLVYTRIFYASVVLVQLAVYYFTTLKIKQKNDLKVLTYTEPAKPMSGDGPTQVTTTVKDYDLAEASKAIRGVLMGVAFMGFMHGYMKYTQPLFIQGIMPIKSLYDSKILKIHLLGQPATGDLKRPFEAAPGMFDAAMGGADAKKEEATAIAPKKDEKKKDK